jgi:hypothetical protein
MMMVVVAAVEEVLSDFVVLISYQNYQAIASVHFLVVQAVLYISFF